MSVVWWPEPAPGEIVWCHFPENYGADPGDKPRPALITAVYDDEDPQFYVEVVYGTSQKTNNLYAGEFLISNSNLAAYQQAGLSYTTKFNFKISIQLPYNDEFFKVPPNPSHGNIPKLGSVHVMLQRHLFAAYQAANSDIK